MRGYKLAFAMAAILLVGCSSSLEVDNPFGSDSGSTIRLASIAANEYPKGEASNLSVTALINRDKETVQIINPTDQAFSNARIWINAHFVAVSTVPANGSVTLKRERFINGDGKALSDLNTTAKRVELQEGPQFYRLLGPVFE